MSHRVWVKGHHYCTLTFSISKTKILIFSIFSLTYAILTSCTVPGSYCHRRHIAESTVHTEDGGLWDKEAGGEGGGRGEGSVNITCTFCVTPQKSSMPHGSHSIYVQSHSQTISHLPHSQAISHVYLIRPLCNKIPHCKHYKIAVEMGRK